MSDATIQATRGNGATWRISSQKIVNIIFFTMIVSGAIAVIEPSP